jgi:hypothetical protein
MGKILALSCGVGGVIFFMRQKAMESHAFGNDVDEMVEPVTDDWRPAGQD